VKLHKLIGPEHVYLDLDAASMETALQVAAEKLGGQVGIAADGLAKALLDRERLGSTAVGEGFAIPHCKVRGINTIQVALARFVEGLEFHAADRAPVRFFFVVLSPPDQPAAHLQVLSQIARVLKRKHLRDDLLQAPDPSSVVTAVQLVAEAEGL
jgi:mannitol/fructose-specific phosphotransferase system IIA component (Ntr-type)